MTATQRAVACRRGRREAVSVTTPQPVVAQDDVIFNEPGRRSRCRAGRRRGLIAEGSRGAGYGNGAALQITSLVQSTGFASFMPAVRKAKVELRGFNSPAQSRQREAVRLTPCRKAELRGTVSINSSSRVRADSFARMRSSQAKAGRAHDPQTRAKRTNLFPVEPRSGEFAFRRHRAPKPLNVVAGWIVARHSSVASCESARDVAKGTPGGTFDNPRWRAGARPSGRSMSVGGRARRVTFAKRKPSSVAHPKLLSAVRTELPACDVPGVTSPAGCRAEETSGRDHASCGAIVSCHCGNTCEPFRDFFSANAGFSPSCLRGESAGNLDCACECPHGDSLCNGRAVCRRASSEKIPSEASLCRTRCIASCRSF